VASFPRTIIPFEVSALEMPGPLISKAQSGRVNIRSTQQIGRTWAEHYLINVRSVDGRALLATVDNYWRNGTIFTIDHRDHVTPLGAGGGSPLVNLPPQLVADPENLGAWTVNGILGRTSGQADPLGGTAGYLLDSNTPNTNDGILENISFTGDATKAIAWFMRAGTSTLSRVQLYDVTLGTPRHAVLVAWTAGVPSLSTAAGAGTRFAVIAGIAGWYRLAINATGVIALNTNKMQIDPDANGGGGTVYAFGANAWNASTPGPYSGPSQAVSTGANLYVDGVTASISNWLRGGDIIRVAGISPTYEVAADVTTDANNMATIPITPPLFSGGSPVDNAAVTITGVTLTACILEPPTYPSTSGSSNDYGELVVKFSETL
jgi:hypothetical protein